MNLTTSKTELQRKQNDQNDIISCEFRQHADEISKQTKETEKYRSLQLKLKRRLHDQKNAFTRRCQHYNDQLATKTQELEQVYATKLEYQSEKCKRHFLMQLAQKSDCINDMEKKVFFSYQQGHVVLDVDQMVAIFSVLSDCVFVGFKFFV